MRRAIRYINQKDNIDHITLYKLKMIKNTYEKLSFALANDEIYDYTDSISSKDIILHNPNIINSLISYCWTDIFPDIKYNSISVSFDNYHFYHSSPVMFGGSNLFHFTNNLSHMLIFSSIQDSTRLSIICNTFNRWIINSKLMNKILFGIFVLISLVNKNLLVLDLVHMITRIILDII